MNIHLPAILGFTRCQGFDQQPYMTLRCGSSLWSFEHSGCRTGASHPRRAGRAAAPKSCCMAWNLWNWHLKVLEKDIQLCWSAKSYLPHDPMSTDLAKTCKNHQKTILDDSWVTWHVSLQVCDLSEVGQRLDDKSGRPHSPLHLNGTEIDGLTFSLLVLPECQSKCKCVCVCVRVRVTFIESLGLRMKFVKKSLTAASFWTNNGSTANNLMLHSEYSCWHTMCEGTK